MAATYISTQTADNTSEITFTSGLDSTYDEYMFLLIDIQPVNNDVNFRMQFNASGESGWNEVIVYAPFYAQHSEGGAAGGDAYAASNGALANSTDAIIIAEDMGNTSYQCGQGIVTLFAPSSNTFTKVFYNNVQYQTHNNYTHTRQGGGEINTTDVITDIKFAMDSGNFDGEIQLYGIG